MMMMMMMRIAVIDDDDNFSMESYDLEFLTGENKYLCLDNFMTQLIFAIYISFACIFA